VLRPRHGESPEGGLDMYIGIGTLIIIILLIILLT
jgi:hypothetical protein